MKTLRKKGITDIMNKHKFHNDVAKSLHLINENKNKDIILL